MLSSILGGVVGLAMLFAVAWAMGNAE